MKRHYYLRPYSPRKCQAQDCKEAGTQEIVTLGSHVALGLYCYPHAQEAFAQAERAINTYEDALAGALNLSIPPSR